MSTQHWKTVTRLWFFNTVGWALITLALPATESLFVMLGCLALTLWSNRRYQDANERGNAQRNSEGKQ